MTIKKKVAVFNKYVTNPIFLLFAGRLKPFAEVTHTGRRSGRPYRTPVLAFAVEDGFVMALTYGRDVDWVKNLMASHGGSIKQGGERYPLASVYFICRDEAERIIPFLVRLLLRLNSVEDFIHARTATKTD